MYTTACIADMRGSSVTINTIEYRKKKTALVISLLITAGIIGAVIMIKTGLYLPCPFRSITGYLCPGCGATRMFLALLQLDFATAFHCNPLLIITLPLLLYIVISMCSNYIRNGSMQVGRKTEIMAIILIVIFIVFGFLRNIL